jgi:hypothetical protein
VLEVVQVMVVTDYQFLLLAQQQHTLVEVEVVEVLPEMEVLVVEEQVQLQLLEAQL